MTVREYHDPGRNKIHMLDYMGRGWVEGKKEEYAMWSQTIKQLHSLK
jgi:hypothetical protein